MEFLNPLLREQKIEQYASYRILSDCIANENIAFIYYASQFSEFIISSATASRIYCW